MKTPAPPAILRLLRAAQRRFLVQLFLDATARAALLGCGALVLVAAARRWAPQFGSWDLRLIACAGAGLLFLAMLAAFVRRPSLPTVAALLDRQGATRDRFVTAVALAGAGSEMSALALRECERFLREADLCFAPRLRWPRELTYLLVPLVALAMLQWETTRSVRSQKEELAATRTVVESTAARFEEMARQLERVEEEDQAEELKKIAEQLQRGAERLRTTATNPAEAVKAALRELSALEQLVQEMQQAPAPGALEERSALASALEENDATRDAAAALQAGDLEKAARELEKAMQQLAQQNAERTAAQIEQALARTLQQLAARPQTSAALKQVAGQLSPRPGQQPGEASRKLAQALRQMQQNPRDRSKSKAAQQVLAALQEMKFGDKGEARGMKPGEGEPTGAIAVQAFATPGSSASPGEGDPQQASAQPNTTPDRSTTDHPFGNEAVDFPGETQKRQLAGRLSEGESLPQLAPTAGDASKSNRRYKELYEAMAPAAQDAVLQENIPLGSRFLIQRYFESIRPKD